MNSETSILHFGDFADAFVQSDLTTNHSNIHAPTAMPTTQFVWSISVRATSALDTGAGDRTGNLLVTSQPALPPEQLPPRYWSTSMPWVRLGTLERIRAFLLGIKQLNRYQHYPTPPSVYCATIYSLPLVSPAKVLASLNEGILLLLLLKDLPSVVGGLFLPTRPQCLECRGVFFIVC